MNWILALTLAFAEPSSETTDTGNTSEPSSETTDTGNTSEPATEDTSVTEASSEPATEDTSPEEPTSEPATDSNDTNVDTAFVFESAADKADEFGGFGCSTIQFGGIALFWFAAILASFRREK